MRTDKLRGQVAERYKSWAAFARAIGWPQNKVQRLLRGDYIPDVDEAAMLAESLGFGLEQTRDIFLSTESPNGDKGVTVNV